MPAFDAGHAATYSAGAFATVPGLAAIHRIAGQLLAETVAPDAHLLVIGAGGGLEMEALAKANPGLRFTGIDPSQPMLDAARARLGPLAERATLLPVTTPQAPAGPFDGALSLLTFHFIPRDERLPTLTALHARLRPGAPLFVMHMSFPPDEAPLWFTRNLTFAGTDPARLPAAVAIISERLTILSPEEEEAQLRAAGFTAIAPIWQALGFRGWLARA